MNEIEFNLNNETTIAIIIGASKWPHAKFQTSHSFSNSANVVKKYLSDICNLSEQNILNLFNSSDSPSQHIQKIANFIRSRRDNSNLQNLLLYFIGHGAFTGDGTYYLAINSTEKDVEYATGLQVENLAYCLKREAKFLRRFVFLDCCFSAKAVALFQSEKPHQAAILQVSDALKNDDQVDIFDSELPTQGTSIICSSSPFLPSKIGENYTMFTGSLYKVLTSDKLSPLDLNRLSINVGNDDRLKLSMRHLHELTWTQIRRDYGEEAIRPEIHSPVQKEGILERIPLFPLSQKFNDLKDNYNVTNDVNIDQRKDKKKSNPSLTESNITKSKSVTEEENKSKHQSRINYRTITKKELEDILKRHKIWLDNKGSTQNYADLSRVDLRGFDLSEANLQEANLKNTLLEGVNFTKANLSKAKLAGANLQNTIFHNTNLSNANLFMAHLAGTDFTDANLRDCDFKFTSISDSIFHGANLSGVNLYGSSIKDSDLRKVDLSSADLSMSSIINSNLSEAKMHSIKLNKATLENVILVKAELKNAILPKCNFFGVDCTNASFNCANLERSIFDKYKYGKSSDEVNFSNLREVDFSNANLKEVQITDADLIMADFSNADLTSANLSNSYLREANFFKSKLIGSQLVNVNLREANLNGAKLQKANLYKARILLAKFDNSNLSYAELNNSNLNGSSFKNANLKGALLKNSKLILADLKKANLTKADLTEAEAPETNFEEANLEQCNFSNGLLAGAKFDNAQINRANFLGAFLEGARFFGVNLKEASFHGAKLRDIELNPKDLLKFNRLSSIRSYYWFSLTVLILLLSYSFFFLYEIFNVSTNVLLQHNLPLVNMTTIGYEFISEGIPYAVFLGILIILFLGLNITIQRVWINLSRLPVMLPDSNVLGTSYFSGLIKTFLYGSSDYFPKNTSSLLKTIKIAINFFRLWFVPILILIAWIKISVFTISQGFFHFLFFSVSFWLAIGFYLDTFNILSGSRSAFWNIHLKIGGPIVLFSVGIPWLLIFYSDVKLPEWFFYSVFFLLILFSSYYLFRNFEFESSKINKIRHGIHPIIASILVVLWYFLIGGINIPIWIPGTIIFFCIIVFFSMDVFLKDLEQSKEFDTVISSLRDETRVKEERFRTFVQQVNEIKSPSSH